jgi:hypothetical protein
MSAVRTLRAGAGGDFVPELQEILTLSRVREDSHCLQADVRRVASYYLKEWAGVEPLAGDPKPRYRCTAPQAEAHCLQEYAHKHKSPDAGAWLSRLFAQARKDWRGKARQRADLTAGSIHHAQRARQVPPSRSDAGPLQGGPVLSVALGWSPAPLFGDGNPASQLRASTPGPKLPAMKAKSAATSSGRRKSATRQPARKGKLRKTPGVGSLTRKSELIKDAAGFTGTRGDGRSATSGIP